MAFKRKRNFKKHTKRHIRKKMKSTTVTLTCPYRSGQAMFPDVYRALGHTNYTRKIASGTVSTDTMNIFAFQFNCKSQVNNITFWDGSTWTGAANAAPAGLFYLLGDNNRSGVSQGANCPYLRGRVTHSTIKARWLPRQDGAHPVDTRIVIFPTNYNPQNTLAGASGQMSLGTLSEQPFAKVYDYTWEVSTRATTMTNSVSSLKLLGDRYKASIESGLFDFDYSNSPAVGLWWVVAVSTIGADANYYAQGGVLEMDFYDRIELFSKSVLISSVPA